MLHNSRSSPLGIFRCAAKARYKFPYGDFERVHRCGLIAAEVRAARQKDLDIEDAAIRLREMMDKQDR